MQECNQIMLLFTFTMLFGGGMIPNYILVRNLHMTNTIWSMLIPGAMSVYNMIVARTFIQSNIPEELLDAAKIDGCDDIHIFYRIVLPLSKAILAVLGLWYAVGHWNAYFNAFLYLQDQNLYPLQIFLRDILVQENFDSSMMGDELAAEAANLKLLLKYSIIVISTAPLFTFYPFVQKYFVKGVMIGSVKG
ncbi:MAG: carbohydrate ABC transporter permease [Lachnospiraceae bacterium]|nr:carbohydrate ABC transporter permease [Lachnospiraceae bacterium]